MVIRDLPREMQARPAVDDDAPAEKTQVAPARRPSQMDVRARRSLPLHAATDDQHLNSMLEEAFREYACADRDAEYTRHSVLRQRQRLETEHARSLRAGTELLRAGEYTRATVALTMAAKVNQGDPLCRVRLALSRLAQGHYTESSLALQRALALQPKLIYLDLGIAESFPRADVLSSIADDLSRHARSHPEDREAQFLRGFLEFQLGNLENSHAAFRAAARGGLDTEALRAFLDITRPPLSSSRR